MKVCKDCRFWSTRSGISDDGTIGECFRHAPRPAMSGQVHCSPLNSDGCYTVWPETGAFDWCGEWEPAEDADAACFKTVAGQLEWETREDTET